MILMNKNILGEDTVMFQKLGVQLYTLRNFLVDPDIADVAFEKIAALGYSEAQVNSYLFDDKTLLDLTSKHGISIIGSHYDYKKILANPEEVMAIHDMWGTKNVGIGGMPKEARENLDALKAFIKQFNETAELYAKKGFKLTYHNHQFEFERIDGYKTIMDMLYEGLDPATTSFVFDTCWASAGGADVVAWMEKLAGRIDILHLKDLTLKRIDRKFYGDATEIGNGNLSWDPIMKMAEQIGVKHYIVEQDNDFSPTPFASLKMSADFLAKYKA